MDAHAHWNQTADRHGSRAATAFLLFNCAVLTLTLALGLPGNLWVCWVVFRNRSLQTCDNALLVSLAASDLLKCSVDTPLLLFSFLRQGGGGGGGGGAVPACTLQQFTFALCSCVQLLTLVGISVERFQAIAFPFQTEGRRARVRLWIPSIWACGLVLAVVSLTLSGEALFYMLCRTHVGGGGARPRHPDPFGPYVLVPLWGLSLTLVVVHYVRIFKVVRRHRKRVFKRGVQLRPTVSEHVWGWLSVPAAQQQQQQQRQRAGPLDPLPPVCSGSPPVARRTVLLVDEDGAACAGTGASAGTGAPGRPPRIVGAVCLLTPGARERGKKRMEGKLAQRFGYIVIAFALFWLPMVVILLMNVFCWQDADTLLVELETSAVVLTCMQAAVDPLIYTLVTRQFRSELSKILSSIPGCPLKPRA